MWMEKPSTQCAAVLTLIGWEDEFQRSICCLHGKFDNFDHSCDWFLDDFRNRLIVQNSIREIRVDNCAEAKKNY